MPKFQVVLWGRFGVFISLSIGYLGRVDGVPYRNFRVYPGAGNEHGCLGCFFHNVGVSDWGAWAIWWYGHGNQMMTWMSIIHDEKWYFSGSWILAGFLVESGGQKIKRIFALNEKVKKTLDSLCGGSVCNFEIENMSL